MGVDFIRLEILFWILCILLFFFLAVSVWLVSMEYEKFVIY